MLSRIINLRLLAIAGLVTIAGLVVANAYSIIQASSAQYGDLTGTYTFTTEPTGVSTSSFTSPPTGSNGGGSVPTTDTTSNWAGYVSTGGTYTSVSGSWDVPNVTASDDPMAADATWIGIGGDSSDDLIQIGTQNMVQDGQVTTGTFYERLPDTSEAVPGVNVNAGDEVTASIRELSTGMWAISINDITSGESYSNTVAYDSSESSAEWIEEAPSTGASIIPLDQFGSVTFTAGYTTENNKTVSIAGSNANVLTMDNEAGQALTSTSAIDSSGSSFTVSRTSASSDDDLYSYGQYEDIPGGWTRHEPGRGMWSYGWGNGETQPFAYTNYY